MEGTKIINQTKKDILGCLPPEVVQNITLYLTPKALENASICNQGWNNLINRNYFWYKKCQACGYNELIDISLSAIYEKYLIRFPLYWQLLFNYNQLQYNWTNDIFTTASVTGNSIIELHHFDEEILVATNRSRNNIFIIDSYTGQIKNTISLSKCILNLLKYQNLLVIVMFDDHGKHDKYLQVLTIQGELVFTTKLDEFSTGDRGYPVNLKVYKTLISIDNRFGRFQIIDFEKQTISYTKSNVCYVCFGDEVIALGKNNGTVEILDMNYKKLRTYNHGMREKITIIQITQDYMITFATNRYDTLTCDVYVWNLKEIVILYTIKRVPIMLDARFTYSICRDRLIFVREGYGFTYYHNKSNVVVLDLPTGNQIFDINISSTKIMSSLISNGHYMFVNGIPHEGWRSSSGATTDIRIHSTKSGKEIAFINNIYINEFTLYNSALMATETKLAYITNKGDLVIRNYEMQIN